MDNDDNSTPNALPAAAKRALEEARERKRIAAQYDRQVDDESGGPSGPEPTRYGDWERKGKAVDF